MSEKLTTNALPKLPGYEFKELHTPASYNKSHLFDRIDGRIVTKDPPGSQPVKKLRDSTVQFSNEAIFNRHPQWKTLTGKVLRFFGYFKEKVLESPIEAERIRKVIVLFHLVDRTVTVNETPLPTNSGMHDGCLMSRHLNPDITLTELKIGAIVPMRSRNIKIVDSDAFTRTFFEVMGSPLGEPLEYPEDTFESRQAPPGRRIDPDHLEMKHAAEALAASIGGHHMSTLGPEQREKAKSFMRHDREVLNFYATWDKRRFRVNFFLADGTMSVTALHAPNDGRDQLMAFVKRGKIPNGKFVVKSIDSCSIPRGQEPVFFTEQDLKTGATITLFGRDFYLYDCDPFTKEYYKSKYGWDQKPVEKGWTEGDPVGQLARMELPAYNGFGTDEDSLGSFKHLVLKPPRVDYAKYIRHANDVLRFGAQIADPCPEDAGRMFIVCYYLADDTAQVFELITPNSGHVGGKVFARAKVKDLTPESLYVGAEVKLGGFVFKLTEMDDRTQNFLETGVSMGAVQNSKADELLARVRIVLTQRFSRVTDAYRHFNVSKSGLGISDLKRIFQECEVKLENDQLLSEVMQLVDADKDGIISLEEFVENLLRQALVPKKVVPDPDVPASSYVAIQEKRAQKEFADKVLRMFIAKLEARRAFIVDTFRIVSDRSIDGLIGVDTFKRVVTDRLGLSLAPEELDALVFKFYFVEGMPDYLNRRLSLREFRKVLDS